MKPKWSFTVILGFVYLAAFHLWMLFNPPWIRATAVLSTTGLAILLCVAWRRRYFVNGWDAFIHASIIADILLEGLLIKTHERFGFYWCALAFGIVLVGYRAWVFPRLESVQQRTSNFTGNSH